MPAPAREKTRFAVAWSGLVYPVVSIGEPADPATVEVSAPDGLQLLAGDNEFEFASVEPAQVYRRSIRVTPTAEGVFLLTLTVNLKHDQSADTRVFSLPLIVGAPAPASSGNPPPAPPASPTG